MRLRSFHGDNLNDAMRQVREALGPDAIIVATRDDDQGGIRVTAAVDDVLSTLNKEAAAKKPAATAKPAGPIDYSHDVVETVADHLSRHAVPAALAESLLATVTHFADHDALIALGAAMDKLFRFAPLFEKLTRPICLVGPPGAGKTIAIAKIATSRVMNGKTVGVITTDLQRAGAVEHLSAYTRLLRLNLLEIEDTPALKDAIQENAKNELILIDSSGRNPFNRNEMQDLKKILSSADVEPVLVMPAGIDVQEGTDITRAFMELGATRMIVTKVDMVKRLGSVMGFAHDTPIHLCEMSTSARATDPLQPLNPVTFARLLLPPELIASILKNSKKSQVAR